MKGLAKNAMAVIVGLLAASSGFAAVTGSAETTSCSPILGGVTGYCKMTKVAGLFGLHDFDRLKWNCVVQRTPRTVKSKTNVIVVPTIYNGNPKAKWSKTASLKTNEQRPNSEYCTYNNSYFFNADAGGTSSYFGVNAADCIVTGGANDRFDN